MPVHSESETNSTDYVWEKNKFYSRGTEGFALGRTDANGFNNISAENSINPEILIMGTSHTEGFNVAQDENYSYLINNLMNDAGMNMNTYNIGISGHRITTCLNNLKNAVEEFNPSRYVILEVTTTEMSVDEINQVSEGTVKKIHSSANPILIFLQKIPFVRCVYSQIDKMGLEINLPTFKKDQKKTNQESLVAADTDEEYRLALNLLMEQIGDIAMENDVKLIIFNHSDLRIDTDGKVIPMQRSGKSMMFEEACRKNGIEFLDMYDAFSENYSETYHLPHGFSNTAVGKGHLNKFGHEVIANELYELIKDLESQNKVVF